MTEPVATRPRVCHLTTVHEATDVRIFHKECRTLQEAGFEVIAIAPAGGPDAIGGVRIRSVVVPRSRIGRATVGLWRAFGAARAVRAGLYHFHDPELLPAGLALRLLGHRVLYDVHEDAPRAMLSKPYLSGLTRPLVARAVELLEWLGARLLSGVVAATPQIARRFPAGRTITVMNYPRLEELVPTAEVPYVSRRPQVLYLGGLTEIRGAREMVRAMEAVTTPGASLLLAGRVAPASLQDSLAGMAGWRVTRAPGHLSRAEVSRALGESRVGLVLLHDTPAYRESYPVKLFEYMAAGLPVVASAFPLWRELVEGNGAGLIVDQRDPEAIARAISYLLDHPVEAEAMGRRGRRAVEDKYGWAAEGEKLVAFYHRLLGPESRLRERGAG